MATNLPFLGIMVTTILVQLVMVEFGGRMVKCWPLNWQQNLICIIIGFGELPWGIIVKLIPLNFFFNISLEDKDEEDEGK